MPEYNVERIVRGNFGGFAGFTGTNTVQRPSSKHFAEESLYFFFKLKHTSSISGKLQKSQKKVTKNSKFSSRQISANTSSIFLFPHYTISVYKR